MTALHYSIVSEKMVWIWYYDHLGAKHLKELLADDAAAFVKREIAEKAGDTAPANTSGTSGMEFLKQYQNTN